jgi:hypothetical protein
MAPFSVGSRDKLSYRDGKPRLTQYNTTAYTAKVRNWCLGPAPRLSQLSEPALRFFSRTVALATSSSLFLFISGCAQFDTQLSGLRIWAAPESATLSPASSVELENEVFSDAARAIRLDAAVNETTAFQLVLTAGTTPASVWGITVSDLRSQDDAIPADQVELFREIFLPTGEHPAWYLRLTPHLRSPMEVADPLIPFTAPQGALPIELGPYASAVVWVDVHVPPGTPPGTYESRLRVTSRSSFYRELTLTLEVWPFALPHTRHLTAMAGVEMVNLCREHLELHGQPYAPARLSFDDPAAERAVATLDQTLRLLHRHRLSPMLMDVDPLARLGSDGRTELEWDDYDRLVTGILEGSLFADRTAAAAWPLPVSERNPAPDVYGGWGSRAYDQALKDTLRQSAAHFRERGWLDRHFALLPLPGPTRADRYAQFEKLGRLAREADPALRLLCPLAPQPMAPYGLLNDPFRDLSSFTAIWCPPAEVADPDVLRRQKSAGKVVWFAPGRPPFSGSLSVIAPSDHARSIAWQAYRMGCEGLLLPAMNPRTAAAGSGESGSGSSASQVEPLLWPGRPYGLNRPIPSIRLKRLRRGLQDYEYLWLLEQNRRPGIARLIAGDLFAYGGTDCYGEHLLDGRPNGWSADPGAWTLARRLMSRELVAAMEESKIVSSQPLPAEDTSKFEQQIEWARLAESVRRIRADVEGVRVAIEPSQKDTPVRLDVTVALYNATRDPFEGELAFADVPENWRLTRARAPVGPLEPRRSSRRILTGHVPGIATNVDGVLPIGLSLGSGDKDPLRIPARVCALTAQRLTRPIALDGKLDDWPLGTTNVAGDFILVGALDVPKRGRFSPDRASQATSVFVCTDREYLYIGFNCADDRLSERVVSRSNTVRYEDLWPVGEDLVEVVLDPTGRAVDPGELLHIVVKANGAVISERGTPCLAGVARHSGWPAGVTAALDDTALPDRWTVEIRIPLAALGNPATTWGVNFGRFQARLGEYSSWSGARRYLYSPASLGNMRLAEP